MNHLGAPLALCLCLTGNGADHVFIEVDMLDLDIGDLDAPGIGLGVENLLYVEVELFPLGEHIVQLVFAQYRTQGGLRQLAGGHQVILHLNDGFFRVHDPKVQHRIDLDRDIVTGDHILLRHIHGDHPQINPHHLLDTGDNDNQARTLHLPEAAQQENHAALVFAQNANGAGEQHEQ